MAAVTPDKAMPRGTHTLGIALAALGVILALIRMWWLPTMPKLAPVILIVTALGVMLVGIVRRVRCGMRTRR